MTTETLITKIGVIIVSVVALLVAYQTLLLEQITSTQFMMILWAVLGAWGLGAVGNRFVNLAKEAGVSEDRKLFSMLAMQALMKEATSKTLKEDEKK